MNFVPNYKGFMIRGNTPHTVMLWSPTGWPIGGFWKMESARQFVDTHGEHYREEVENVADKQA